MISPTRDSRAGMCSARENRGVSRALSPSLCERELNRGTNFGFVLGLCARSRKIDPCNARQAWATSIAHLHCAQRSTSSGEWTAQQTSTFENQLIVTLKRLLFWRFIFFSIIVMDSKSEAQTHVRVVLTDEEIGLTALDDICNKYADWLKLTKQEAGGRKTRAANRRADAIYDEIMNFKLAPIPSPQTLSAPKIQENVGSSKNSLDSDGSSVGSSGVASASSGRILRPRFPVSSQKEKKQETSPSTPSTPTHQSIRAVMKKNPDSKSSNVLCAALKQEHPSVSVTKLRHIMRADSAQKKREEEKERQERLVLERKAKEERAEAQKKQLLEERAVTAKLKREQRLLHAAEVRKAREKAKIELKLKEALPEPKPKQPQPQQQIEQDEAPKKKVDEQPVKIRNLEETKQLPAVTQPAKHKLDGTFEKPADDNIDISVHDETNEEPTKKVNEVASWAKAPHFRDLVVAQFSKQEEQILREALEIFGNVKLPVDLEQIFASHKLPSNKRYLARTSSAVWTPPHRPIKRTSSAVFTPTDQKR